MVVVVVVGTSVVVVVNAGASVDDVVDGLSVVVVAEGSVPGVAIESAGILRQLRAMASSELLERVNAWR